MTVLLGLLLGGHLVFAAADRVPEFDYMPSCRAGSESNATTLGSCVQDEKEAREQLVKEWAQFPATDKVRCTDETEEFAPSYVELLECLAMYRDVRTMPKDQNNAKAGGSGR
jgi:hypothetical protein